jgi:prophage regulatory protein
VQAANDNRPLLLRISDVERAVGLGRSSIYRNIAAGKFPKPVELGTGAVRWRYDAIREWADGLTEVQARAAA